MKTKPRISATMDALEYLREKQARAREKIKRREQRRAASQGGNRKRLRSDRQRELFYVDVTMRLRVRVRMAIDGCDTYHMAVQEANRHIKGPGRPLGVMLPVDTLVMDQVVLDGKNPHIMSVIACTAREEGGDANAVA